MISKLGLPDRERIKKILETEALQDQHLKSDAFERRLSGPFLDRIDYFIPFCQLRYADVARILDREVSDLQKELEERGVDLKIMPRVKTLLFWHHTTNAPGVLGRSCEASRN